MALNDMYTHDEGEDLIAQTLLLAKKRRTERRDAVQKARLNAPDKEPFDIEKLGELYSLQGDSGIVMDTKKYARELLEEYYLRYPDIKTLQDFADRKKFLDAYASN